MSIISEQVKELRYKADIYNTVGSAWELNRAEAKILQELLRKAADTIESLSAKLQAANMEVERLREVTICNGEWIYCGDGVELPSESGEYQIVSDCQEIFVKLNFDASDKTWYDNGGQYYNVIAWWRVYPYEP